MVIPGRLLNSATLEIQPANGRGERLDLSTAVGVEYNDVLFVGEVVRCTAAAGDQWEIDVKVAQTLTGLQSLLMLRAQLNQHQIQSKDAATEEPILCAVLSEGKNKEVKTHPEYAAIKLS
mgnify:CR=1 FL=1